MFTKIKRWWFKLQMKWYKDHLKESQSFAAYPMLVSMEFNEDFYWRRYLRGHSVKKSIEWKMNRQNVDLARRIDRKISEKAMDRLYRMREHKEYQQYLKEENEEIAEANKLIDDYENKLKDS